MKDKIINVLDWIYIICAILLAIKGEYEIAVIILLVNDIMNIKHKLNKIDNKLNNI